MSTEPYRQELPARSGDALELDRPPRTAPRELPSRRVLLRDVLIFHAKLWLDGAKDIALAPLSLIMALLDVVLGPARGGYRFYAILRAGERFDLWLNLFGNQRERRIGRRGILGLRSDGDASFVGTLNSALDGGAPEEERTAPLAPVPPSAAPGS